MQSTWDDIMGQMIAFVDDTNADIDMAYDWVCEMLDIDSFVDNEAAWNSFYDVWESCDNRNDLNAFQINWLLTTNKWQWLILTSKILSKWDMIVKT